MADVAMVGGATLAVSVAIVTTLAVDRCYLSAFE
jgi:hypothetical protein